MEECKKKKRERDNRRNKIEENRDIERCGKKKEKAYRKGVMVGEVVVGLRLCSHIHFVERRCLWFKFKGNLGLGNW